MHIQALQTGDYLRPGATVDLVLVAVNQSPDITDKLVGITTDIGKVTVTGDRHPARQRRAVLRRQNGQPKKSDNAIESRRHGQGDHRVEQADHQRPELRRHVQFREGRQRQRAGADFGAGKLSSANLR